LQWLNGTIARLPTTARGLAAWSVLEHVRLGHVIGGFGCLPTGPISSRDRTPASISSV